LQDTVSRGDRKAGHHPGRQINLLSREWLLGLQDVGYRIEPGQFGEQITVLGIDFETLKVGAQLQLGRTACLEIRQARNKGVDDAAASFKTPEQLKGYAAPADRVKSDMQVIYNELKK
jgi:hypothetical protein